MGTAAKSFSAFFEESAPLAIEEARGKLSEPHQIEDVLLNAYLLTWARHLAAREWSVDFLLTSVDALSTSPSGEKVSASSEALKGVVRRQLERIIDELEKARNESAMHASLYVVLPRVREVLGTTERSMEWLLEKNYALGDVAPIELLGERGGIDKVSALLDRIEHGTFS